MSDKLFKNDLTPSECQRDGNFEQASASSAVSLTLPCHALHTLWSPLLEKTPLRGEFSSLIILWVLGAWTVLRILGKPGGSRPVCQPGWDALLGCDQQPFLTVAGEILTPLCGSLAWLLTVSNLLKIILRSLSKSIKVNHFFCPDEEVPGHNSQVIFTILESICNTWKFLHEMGHFLFR